MSGFATADLCDAHDLQVVAPLFRPFGLRASFFGPVATLKVFEDNTLVRAALERPGEGRVLVVDGGGSTRCALLGDKLATLAIQNQWAGVVLHGCIRDAAVISGMNVGIRAIATSPRKSQKRGEGQADVTVSFGGATFRPDDYVYVDADGIVVAAAALT
ncbi:MAG: ribonuclease E activity regulator RraA [Myxococcota bacterium]